MHRSATCGTENKKDKQIMFVALTSKKTINHSGTKKDTLLYPDCVFAVVVNSSLARSFYEIFLKCYCLPRSVA